MSRALQLAQGAWQETQAVPLLKDPAGQQFPASTHEVQFPADPEQVLQGDVHTSHVPPLLNLPSPQQLLSMGSQVLQTSRASHWPQGCWQLAHVPLSLY